MEWSLQRHCRWPELSSTCMMWFTSVLILTLTSVYAQENVEVSTPSGKMLGTKLTSRLGKTIYTFRGIRYAEAPANDLRFKPPVPTGRWNGVYNATADGPSCPQPIIRPISDDCLFLNVYSTKLPNGRNNVKRPVIIYIHSGGFYSYTSSSVWFGPQYFLDQEIVLVTISYRLASLGFLSVGKESPGNNGLRDQVVALKWVKKHIASFGGDPDNVTLFGCSAGGWSIQLHMVSPMSRGLFHKAILSSGSVLGQWPLPRTQLDIAKKQARIVGCPDNDAKEIIKCLKTKSVEELGNSFWQFAEFGYDPVLIWSPVIENDYGQERFLSDQPIKLFHEGKFEKIPLIAGRTKDEFAARAYPITSNASLLKELSDNWEKWSPVINTYERDTPKSREISRAFRKHYFPEGPLTDNPNATFDGLAKLGLDSMDFAVTRGLELISQKNTKPVYDYIFSYQGRFSGVYRPGTNIPYGVAHEDDLIYLFYISPIQPFFNSSYPESKMVERLTTLWANFAKTGKPIPVPNPKLDNAVWKPFTKDCPEYMDIGDKLVLKTKENDLSLWRRLFPISSYL